MSKTDSAVKPSGGREVKAGRKHAAIPFLMPCFDVWENDAECRARRELFR